MLAETTSRKSRKCAQPASLMVESTGEGPAAIDLKNEEFEYNQPVKREKSIAFSAKSISKNITQCVGNSHTLELVFDNSGNWRVWKDRYSLTRRGIRRRMFDGLITPVYRGR